MISNEQQGKANAERGMSMLMWDMLTGGALYRDVLKRVFHPAFWTRFLWNILASLLSPEENKQDTDSPVTTLPHHITDSQSMETNTLDIVQRKLSFFESIVCWLDGNIM